MKTLRIALPLAICGIAMAQTPPASNQDDIFKFKSSTFNVVAPVLVTDHAGNIIDGLQPNQFHLYDNGKEQNIQVDQAFEPISLVVAIECAGRVASVLPQI